MNNEAIGKFLTTRTKINSYYILVVIFLIEIIYLQIAFPISKIEGNFWFVLLIFAMTFAFLGWCHTKLYGENYRKTNITEIIIFCLILLTYLFDGLALVWVAIIIAWLLYLFFVRSKTKVGVKVNLFRILYSVAMIGLYWATANLLVELAWITEISAKEPVPVLILIFNFIAFILPIWIVATIFHFWASYILKLKPEQ